MKPFICWIKHKNHRAFYQLPISLCEIYDNILSRLNFKFNMLLSTIAYYSGEKEINYNNFITQLLEGVDKIST